MGLRDRAEIVAFKNAAEQFCTIIESEPVEIRSWGEEVVLSLSMLYAYGGLLPPESDFPEDFPDLPDESELSHDEWSKVFNKIALYLHPQRSDWKCHICPDNAEPHDISGILADNLAGIYRALRS
ncbi:MAG: hypothetical protein WBP29_12070 [Candidatus Zixiibacteriota bacterium]